MEAGSMIIRWSRRLFDSLLRRKHTSAHHWVGLSDLKSPQTIVDVGVAAGTPELYDAFPVAHLILIEPVPMFHKQIEETILARRPGTLLKCAAGAIDGDMTINVELRDPSKSSMLQRTPLTRVAGDKKALRVPVATLTTLLHAEILGNNALLKIDTEGYELEVLRGTAQRLPEFRYVITETSIMKRFEDSYDFSDLVGYMRERGFEVRQVLAAPRDGSGRIRMVDLLFENSRGATA
jgi:FkbM family methyltransferase